MNFNSDLKSHLKKKYKELFKDIYPDSVHEELVKTKIEYEIEMRKISSENKKPSAHFLQNYESAMEFEVMGMTKGLRDLLLARMK